MQKEDESAPDARADDPAGDAAESPGFPDRRYIDLSRDPTPGVPDHAAEPGAEPDPLIDLSRDPTPGVPFHALPEDE
ncbi:MAG: hypothetical protein JWR88_1587 [Pseudonocardia sp.]|nr:hypothetical protein [Pseudonocardia sp.]